MCEQSWKNLGFKVHILDYEKTNRQTIPILITPHLTKHEFALYVRTMSSFQRHESQRAMNLQRPPISPNSPSYRLHHTNTKQHWSKSKNTQAKRFSVTPGGTP